jgi:hypothetical protein
MNNSVPKPHRQNLLNKITKLYFISKYMWLVFFFCKTCYEEATNEHPEFTYACRFLFTLL